MEPIERMRHPLQGQLNTNIERPAIEVIQRLAESYTGFLLDRLGKQGAMNMELASLQPGMKFCGPAITVLGADLSVRRMAINIAQCGDVLVVAAGGVKDYACFGDGTANRMMKKGLVGAVLDGATRDAAGLRRLGFPTFCLGVTPRNYHYPVAGEYGAINVPVVCGGVLVQPGDVLLGDDDGVVVIPKEIASTLARTIRAELQQEVASRREVTDFIPFSVEQELIQKGYVIK